MQFNQIHKGEDYEVETSPGYARLAHVLETGTFTKTVYGSGGGYSYRGRKVQTKGARVAFYNSKGLAPKTSANTITEQITVPGPFGGTTVKHVTKTEEVNCTEWVESRQVVRTAAEAHAIKTAAVEREAAKQAAKEQRDQDRDAVKAALQDLGFDWHVSPYDNTPTLSYAQVLKLIEAARNAGR